MNISEKIVLCRKALGISQEELAAMLNISRQAVSRWETGAAMPDTEKIIQLSRVFAVSTDYLLLDEVEEVKPEKQPEQPAVQERPEPQEQTDTAWAVERFMEIRVRERRRKFRMAGWISFLVCGFVLLILSLIFANVWATNTDWWYTDWGRFGTGLFHTGNLALFILGFVVMIPGIAGLVHEYKRED
jgi:transcriptional regulator with XRE-family HTH domain